MKHFRALRDCCLPIIFFMTVASACAGPSAGTLSNKTYKNIATLQQQYVWYDGNEPRTVWLNPSLLAEFESSEATATIMRQRYNGQDVAAFPAQGSVRFWRLESGNSLNVTQQAKSEQYAGRLSPVFHDSPTEGGPLRALPGGLIVTLDPSWEKPQIDNWLIRKGLEVERRLPIGVHTYLLRSAAGIEALELANQLRESGEVVNATPNWWKPSSRR
ncbi:MAG: hypothetical protein JAY74_19820 [Candidatus Thiodiazotropha taylori]|nr:hypothetical protein [Candidatus Thiodiazotropha taylori]RLW51867.1 MAG: hypothetical protein B6D76_17990 [gamma proteobacterium symbiont of Stewartia floridana]